jgi:hypothetical protein
MWLFLSRRLRTWFLLAVLTPLASNVVRRVGESLERRRGPSGLSRTLLRAGALGDQAARRLRGGRGRGARR